VHHEVLPQYHPGVLGKNAALEWEEFSASMPVRLQLPESRANGKMGIKTICRWVMDKLF
jgi:hypothetical protein